ncbi:hypothetical protein HN592_00925 [Candidatus Woesearchaeota archaeon]|jgi:uncharacterized membrane protein|nr:hypothetical protein [Candidatus Woesearchaeota archaeon]MBT4368867.1 hypothetical protein [Candidatus Woesearchaeota archaeon]MBT4712156.1 hypothetical protein [Candidatus Woesearchaeota archaeon]MBT6639096.1 hypothetical protein [Candidatus Woesearchaeota archaeon]MBT7134296.1 hypothetical protein [Candidatus Woesearchaeota archaeon]
MKGVMKLAVFVVCLISLLMVSGLASALPDVDYVKINGDEFETGDTLVVEKGEEIEVKVKLQADQDYTNLRVEAEVLGYEYNDHEDDLEDETHTFDMDAGDTVYKSLELSIPARADKDYYDLRVSIGGRTGAAVEKLYRLNLKGNRHSLEIKRVMLHPANSVEAGSYLLVNAKIINRGEKDEEDVRVTASIPELDLEDSYYIDELEEDESKTSEELFLRIPACTEPGVYEVVFEAEYDEEYESVTETTDIEVVESELCGADAEDGESQSTISVGTQTQQIVRGKGATYSMTITNDGRSDKTYTVGVSGVDDWGIVRVDPSTTVLVKSGQTKSVFAFVTADKKADVGQKSFVMTVSTGDDSQPIQLYANLVKGESGARKWAEVVLIALVILLIVLGLVIGFSRMRRREEMEDEELTGQTYY